MVFHIAKKIYQLLPCFHTLTGSDFTNTFPGHSKIKVFKKMLKTPNSHKLLLSLLCEPNTVGKSLGESCYNMIKTKKNTNKMKQKYNTSKELIRVHSRSSLLGMKILWASFVTHCMLNCLNSCYVPIDSASNWWKFLEKMGAHLV